METISSRILSDLKLNQTRFEQLCDLVPSYEQEKNYAFGDLRPLIISPEEAIEEEFEESRLQQIMEEANQQLNAIELKFAFDSYMDSDDEDYNTILEIIEAMVNLDIELVRKLIQDRTKVTKETLEKLGQICFKTSYNGFNVVVHKMDFSTFYHLLNEHMDGSATFLGAQFFWNEGTYDAQGNHSLYDEHGRPL